jgi:hypothetical protein
LLKLLERQLNLALNLRDGLLAQARHARQRSGALYVRLRRV